MQIYSDTIFHINRPLFKENKTWRFAKISDIGKDGYLYTGDYELFTIIWDNSDTEPSFVLYALETIKSETGKFKFSDLSKFVNYGIIEIINLR